MIEVTAKKVGSSTSAWLRTLALKEVLRLGLSKPGAR